MALEQFGVCAEPNLHSYYLMFNVLDNKHNFIRKILAKLPAMFDGYADSFSESNLNTVIAIGATYWQHYYPIARPNELQPFTHIQVGERIAPANNYDLFIQIRSDRADVNHAVSSKVCELLGNAVELIEQVKGFRYLDGRDLTGFVDGIDNPKGLKKRDVALLDNSHGDFSKGSYLFIQRFRHNMQAWQELSSQQQQHIMGCSKYQDEEFAASQLAPTSHSARIRVYDAEGQPLTILRQSMPYGHMKNQGLFFVGFCHSQANLQQQLLSRYYGDEQDNYDHLLHYTQAETGAAFFVPSLDLLEKAASL